MASRSLSIAPRGATTRQGRDFETSTADEPCAAMASASDFRPLASRSTTCSDDAACAEAAGREALGFERARATRSSVRACRRASLASACSRLDGIASSSGLIDSSRVRRRRLHEARGRDGRPGRRRRTRRASRPCSAPSPVTRIAPMPPVRRHVGAAARGEVPVRDVDETERAGTLRLLPERQRRRLFGAGIAHRDRAGPPRSTRLASSSPLHHLRGVERRR